MEATSFANIPMTKIGPIRIKGKEVNDDVVVPLATYETTLWPSTNRGAIVSRACNGINVIITDERMTRSVAVQAKSATEALTIKENLNQRLDMLQEVTKKTGRFVKLIDFQVQIIGNILFIRFEFTTGDASGHNMATKAADQLVTCLLETYPQLHYISVSGNYCVDKKVSAVNAIRGRGKKVIAEIIIPREVCLKFLKTTPEKIVEVNIKKNYLGSIAAGSLMSANAHFANMLLAFYLATGQDAANIVEGSQGIVSAELQGDNLYFAITAPNIIVGTVGNGKHLPFVKENLELMGCTSQAEPGINSRRLAIICGAVILCGELSLLAALTNTGELVASHMLFERNNR
jgi:hydroxymethylglutaryl-CoA reductase (NADPH)